MLNYRVQETMLCCEGCVKLNFVNVNKCSSASLINRP